MGKYWELKTQLANSENQRVINEYLLSLKIENKSFYTINNLRIFYQRFFKEEKESFSNLKSDYFEKWFLTHTTGLKKNTIRFNLSAISSFYRFCVKEGYVETSPIKAHWFPRSPKPVPKYLDKEEIALIRQQAEKFPLRDRVIVEFLLTSGCRVGEIHTLDKKDVDVEDRIARVTGKGGKIRQVHFSEKTSLLLEKYLQERKDDHPALFVSSKETPTRLSISRIGKVMRQIGKEAELSGSLHPHRLRHTFATELLSKGADLMFIADELGHKDIQTTQIYARLPLRQIISLYRKYMG